MATCKLKKRVSSLYKVFCFVALLVCLFTSATKAYAAAGDVVSNIAIATFTVSGVSNTVESSPTGNSTVGIGNGQPTQFTVDNRVNFSVSLLEAAEISVQPGQTTAVLRFQLSNVGNAIQDFVFTPLNTVANPFTLPADNFNPTNLQVFVESGANAGYQAAEDTATFVNELNFDAGIGNTAIIYLLADIPAAVAVNDVAAMALVAQVAVGGNAAAQGAVIVTDDAGSANDINNIDIVFADPAGANPEDLNAAGSAQDAQYNGQASDAGAFIVAPPSVVTVTKTNAVIASDDGSAPHAAYTDATGSSQSGATVRYTLVVDVDGDFGDVTGVVVVDDIPANTTYVANSITLDTVVQTDADNTAVDFSNYNNINDEVTIDLTQAGAITISSDITYTITFDVTIN